MSQDVALVIQSLFAKLQKLPVDSVDMTADLFEAYGLDSLRAVKLLSSLEVELDIELPSEDTAKIRTLNDVLACAQRALGAR